jgi:hypothetical protein
MVAMFLGLNILGADSVCVTAIPPKIERTGVKFLGESYIDNAHAQNIELSDDSIKNITTLQTWIINSIFLANFEDSLEAGNLLNHDLPITHWRVRRRRSGDTLTSLMAEIPIADSDSSYKDVQVQNGITYEYQVYPVSNGTEGNPIGGVGMATIEYGWVLSNETGTTSFLFDVEIETSDNNVVTDVKKIETLAQFPTVSKGKRRYHEGKITCMPYQIINNNYSFDLETLDALEEFVNNSETKILRNSFGQVFKVQTSDFSYKFMDKISGTPPTVTFSWSQIGTVEV